MIGLLKYTNRSLIPWLYKTTLLREVKFTLVISSSLRLLLEFDFSFFFFFWKIQLAYSNLGRDFNCTNHTPYYVSNSYVKITSEKMFKNLKPLDAELHLICISGANLHQLITLCKHQNP